MVTRRRLCGAHTGLEQVGDVGKCHLDASVDAGFSSTLPSKSTLDAQSATGTVIAWKKPNSGRTRCANVAVGSFPGRALGAAGNR